ncbi:MAG: methyltransferase domain-containing protein [Planctomycetota bacterium]
MRRQRIDELMDDPALDPAEHVRALNGLARLNSWSHAAGPIAREIIHANPKPAPIPKGQLVGVLDVACGSGDVTVDVVDRVNRAGIPADGMGVDVSDVAIDTAQQRGHASPHSVVFAKRDLFTLPLPRGFDVIFCSLFLHHLERERAVELLRKMTAKARSLVVVSDLLRTRTGLFLAQLSTKTLTRSHVVHVDGPRSVRAAFTEDEFRQIAADAGVSADRVNFRRVWPQRFVASWRTNAGD